MWILADSGSVRNSIYESVYNRPPYKPPIREPEDVLVIGNNGKPLDLKGFAVLPLPRLDSRLARVRSRTQFSPQSAGQRRCGGSSSLLTSVS